MNIFILSLCPFLCAKQHTDKHVVKMILEYAQMLSTTHHIYSNNPHKDLYKKAFINHPCTIWVRESCSNYSWLYLLFRALCKEYTFRYKKIHKTETRLLKILNNIPDNIPKGNLTLFSQAMPDSYKHKNPIIGYRTYYIKDKNHIFKWTNRDIPYWI
tara:strand:+ start:931 stop:1401 length:471 start_codon:yes stop_codon:yes gene_type:complete